MIIGLDPGTTRSAIALYGHGRYWGRSERLRNDILRDWLKAYHAGADDILVIEQIAGMGQRVGGEVFETAYWSGRFSEAWESRGYRLERIKRYQVKKCLKARTDAAIRRALIARFGGVKKGEPLHGLAGDAWQALAAAVAWSDLHG